MSRRKYWILGAAALACALLIYAWIDGGHESLHEIAQPVAVPESAR